jgi:hypothetical protein
MTARRLVALLGLSAGVYALAIRPRMIQWGASDEEMHGRHFSDHRHAGKGSKVSPPILVPASLHHLTFSSVVK